MLEAKLVRVVEKSPDGPGLVLQIGSQEVFLPAERAAEWIAKLGYAVVTPIKWSISAETVESLGPIRVTEHDLLIDTDELKTPEGQRKFAEIMLRHPELRRLLGVRRRPDGTIEFEGGKLDGGDGGEEPDG